MDRNNLVGHNKSLPWKLPNDMSHFKQTTTGKSVLMGRLTYESIGKQLPNRNNIILTSNKNLHIENVICVYSIYSILSLFQFSHNELFIVGGSSIYEQFLPYANKLYITHIDSAFYGDSYFPKFDESKFNITSIKAGVLDDKNQYEHTFVGYSIK